MRDEREVGSWEWEEDRRRKTEDRSIALSRTQNNGVILLLKHGELKANSQKPKATKEVRGRTRQRE